MKIKPKKTVIDNPRIVFLRSPLIIAWCAHVAVAPELNKIAVFNKGTSNGSKASIPIGGQTAPILISGPKLPWKKAQKNEKKKHTSDKINKIIPYFNPLCTTKVWCP